MHSPIQLTGSIRTKSRISQWGLLMLLGGLGVIVFLQSRLLMKGAGGGDSQTSLVIQSMQARLNGVSLGIMSYLQNHDPESLARITSEGKEATRLLGDFKGEALQSGNKDAYEAVEKAHGDVREATLNLLAADQTLVIHHRALRQSTDTLMSILTDQMEASIRPSQLNSSGRLKAIREAKTEVRALSLDSSSESSLKAGQSRFEKAMSAYEELSHTRRAVHWSQNARSLFDLSAAHLRDIRQAEEEKQASLDRYHQKRNAFDANLVKNRQSYHRIAHPFLQENFFLRHCLSPYRRPAPFGGNRVRS